MLSYSFVENNLTGRCSRPNKALCASAQTSLSNCSVPIAHLRTPNCVRAHRWLRTLAHPTVHMKKPAAHLRTPHCAREKPDCACAHTPLRTCAQPFLYKKTRCAHAPIPLRMCTVAPAHLRSRFFHVRTYHCAHAHTLVRIISQSNNYLNINFLNNQIK